MPFLPASSNSYDVGESKKRTPKYSFIWAKTILERALLTHPRAWNITKAITGITNQQLIYLIACNDPCWPWIRTVSHTIDRFVHQRPDLVADGENSAIALLSTVLTIHGKTCPNSLKRYLTEFNLGFMLKKQVKRGTGGSVSEPPSGLSSPPEAEFDDC